ncbi:Adenosine 3'-phospho 5'-phosphosulfate transporter 1 [Hypsibius exemplaris]|uniref:Adenosine 3'-phospho 5'-phosphosulfate transporter 1 n=1 Tax=Hypsibius exemplaris TaxID=2072580 RepID=A0A1W0X3V5_HYPEX|nr:Adenosine 3'-phospho 5'-phosphosulfate transporter 1 [Hypsibius exemplaris]
MARCVRSIVGVLAMLLVMAEAFPVETVEEVPEDAVEGGKSVVSVAPSPTKKVENLPLTLLYDLIRNFLTVAVIYIPGYFMKRRYFARGGPSTDGPGRWSALQRLCFVGRPDISNVLRDPESPSLLRSSLEQPQQQTSSSFSRVAGGGDWAERMPPWLMVGLCFFGLQLSYLVWGVVQEKIITRAYDGGERFSDSQFLVFMNRIIAFIISGMYLLLTRHRQPPHRAPYYKYLFASFSNTMSSWLQYEALKYVSFPTQILAKASKVIPVMLMGKVVSGKTYAKYQYISAAIISIGMVIFLNSRRTADSSMTSISTVVGLAVLVGYMVCDSFTVNWQDRLSREYRMTSMQMMFGVNLFSVILTVISLLESGGFAGGFRFAAAHVEFLRDVLLLSVTSAVGQLFIYFTIQRFGPLVFTIIMTVRQACSILLSCFIYGHSVKPAGVFGVTLVFLAVAFEIFARHRRSQAAVNAERGGKKTPK